MLNTLLNDWGFIVERVLKLSGITCRSLSTINILNKQIVFGAGGKLVVLPVLTQNFTDSSAQDKYTELPPLMLMFSLFSTVPITTTNERI